MIGLTYDTELGEFDLLLDNDGALADDDPLRTAVILSLHTDAPVTTEEGTEGGWWGDAYPDAPGDVMGSTLWHVFRSGVSTETAARAEEAARTALAWLLTEKLIRALEVTASRPSSGRIDLAVVIVRLNGGVLRI